MLLLSLSLEAALTPAANEAGDGAEARASWRLILSGMDGAEKRRSVVGTSMLGTVEGPGVGSVAGTTILGPVEGPGVGGLLPVLLYWVLWKDQELGLLPIMLH